MSSTDSSSKFELKRGDRIRWHSYPNLEIKVRRVAKDQTWADILCYVCLIKPERFEIDEETRALTYIANDAVTTIGGTAVCKDHIRSIGNTGILAVNP